ncbi:MAG: L-carnitine dehydratase/bile acid-inducible protein F, partial [uncultured Gemmatimonadetes bacterium]
CRKTTRRSTGCACWTSAACWPGRCAPWCWATWGPTWSRWSAPARATTRASGARPGPRARRGKRRPTSSASTATSARWRRISRAPRGRRSSAAWRATRTWWWRTSRRGCWRGGGWGTASCRAATRGSSSAPSPATAAMGRRRRGPGTTSPCRRAPGGWPSRASRRARRPRWVWRWWTCSRARTPPSPCWPRCASGSAAGWGSGWRCRSGTPRWPVWRTSRRPRWSPAASRAAGGTRTPPSSHTRRSTRPTVCSWWPWATTRSGAACAVPSARPGWAPTCASPPTPAAWSTGRPWWARLPPCSARRRRSTGWRGWRGWASPARPCRAWAKRCATRPSPPTASGGWRADRSGAWGASRRRCACAARRPRCAARPRPWASTRTRCGRKAG